MIRKKLRTRWLVIAGAVVVSASCSCAPKMGIRVTMPAEINLKDVNKIAISSIEGQGGDGLHDKLESALVRSGRFDVVDRQNMHEMVKELKRGVSGLVDENEAVEIGKMLGADALVFGRIAEANYTEKMTEGTWKDNKGGSGKSYHRQGELRYVASLSVTDLRTGRILAKENLTSSQKAATEEYDKTPPAVDQGAMIHMAQAEIVSRFMKKIAPYEVVENVSFRKNERVPSLTQGIAFAQTGAFDKALEVFEEAVEDNPSDPASHYNLGVAYYLNGLHERAIECYQTSYSLKQEKDCLAGIERARARMKEEERLKEQIGE